MTHVWKIKATTSLWASWGPIIDPPDLDHFTISKTNLSTKVCGRCGVSEGMANHMGWSECAALPTEQETDG